MGIVRAITGYGWIMLALIAAVLFLLAGLGVHVHDLNLVWLGLAFFAGHFAYSIPIGTRVRRR